MTRKPAASARVLDVLPAWYQRPWLGVLSRTLASILGGYALAASVNVFLSLALPMQRSQAVLTSMLLAILACACAPLWAFATRSAARAWIGIAVPTLLLALGSSLLGAWA
ncbi:DUF3649 domain-containing protein [Pseudoxanthomonas composti]|uniref:DUF3649 domain-containing protein n=1 Tax=Pseudoxanthomonas composti TaxID=2137479 RepID=A0A4V1N1G3_9GAMM|nr:DUF3649 domain-containing protein [Pseudoxanthomonas composti]RXR07549.1 DUF3649 domain-containing protein [Pseudoxanthomonas composti]